MTLFSTVRKKITSVFQQHKLFSNVCTLSVIYPTANIVQQKFFRENKTTKEINWKEAHKVIEIRMGEGKRKGDDE